MPQCRDPRYEDDEGADECQVLMKPVQEIGDQYLVEDEWNHETDGRQYGAANDRNPREFNAPFEYVADCSGKECGDQYDINQHRASLAPAGGIRPSGFSLRSTLSYTITRRESPRQNGRDGRTEVLRATPGERRQA